jgi:predicted transcriptional regulator
MKEIKIPLPEKEDLDEAMLGVLKFFLDSEAKSKIYLYLRKKGPSTSQEISKGANLYSSSTREALAEMTKKGTVTREKLVTENAGKKPYIYEAIPPSELIKKKIGGIESKLNKLLNLDSSIKEGKKSKAPRMPYRVRIEKTVDEKGEEQVTIESSSEEENQ